MMRCRGFTFWLTGILIIGNFIQTFSLHESRTNKLTKDQSSWESKIKPISDTTQTDEVSGIRNWWPFSTTQQISPSTQQPISIIIEQPITTTTTAWWSWPTTYGAPTTSWWPWPTNVTPSPSSWTWPWDFPTSTSTVGTSPPPTSNLCNCTYSRIWLDVFFIIDSSSAMQRHGLDEATNYLLSVLSKMTVGLYPLETRVGFIYYAKKAYLLSNLTYWRNTDILIDELEIPFDGSEGTNIEEGIKLANNQFSTYGHRENAKKVIVILASSYQNGDYNDPTQAADTFKNDGGVIITVEYAQEHGEEVPFLNQLASPGYNLSNRFLTLHADDMRNLFCNANCFCPVNYEQYSTTNYGSMGGCYYPVNIPSIQHLAVRYCSRHHNSTLVKVDDFSKAQFLKRLFPSKTKFWIGLTQNYYGIYTWPDGSNLWDYSMWAPGYPRNGQGDCVYMYQYSGFQFGWFNDDCNNDFNYICQAHPCDTDHYCEVVDDLT